MTSNPQPARLLGIPLGDFGLFSCVLLSLASGFLAFFGTCFLAIVGLLFWNTLARQQINYADSYRYIALPTGVVVMMLAFAFFTAVWVRRRFAGAA
ncbi:MAG: hypothetical protein WBW84_05675 [Acidobacteriaceae bacterium]